MTDSAARIKNALDKVSVNRDLYNQILKDRLDFGFDSIYFRYSEAIEELSWFKLQEARREGICNFDRKDFCNVRKQHFYNCLEQLLCAHEPSKGDKNDFNK